MKSNTLMDIINKHKLFFVLLSLSILFFLIKGIRYALIDSVVPLVFITLILFSLITFINNDKKYFRLAIWNWGIILLLWSSFRLIAPILFKLTPNLTETHIREQFTIYEFFISFVMLSIGIYLLKNVKKVDYNKN